MIRCVRERVRELSRKQKRFFAWVSLAGLGLRVLLVVYFPGVVDDSRLYANIAENWLRHGVYGITNSGVIVPTLSRLPGYPAFLAAIFALFGVGNFRAVLLAQALFDLATCFLIADLARRLFSWRAAQAAFVARAQAALKEHEERGGPTLADVQARMQQRATKGAERIRAAVASRARAA